MGIGDSFGRLTVIEVLPGSRLRCRCSCGTVKDIDRSNAKRTHSCGCLKSELMRAKALAKRTHGMTRTATYRSWQSAVQRVSNPNHPKWRYWGGRGISMHPAWRASFAAFYADMGERPEGTTLDRIDNDGDYEPGNCRWATASEQRRNRREIPSMTHWS